MQACWKAGEATIKVILSLITPPVPPYTTLASTIRNLERKGYLRSRFTGNVNVYKPVVSPSVYKRKFMNGFVKDYFDNSYKEMVSFFAEQKKINHEELMEIISLIEKGK
ncbi:MAG: BlaI/MecI/CopY family transcriptional regulator [Chitinophagaceae bacterium]|nr:BlaI/MecI/CopY family transcriptional regulator [Chitinophagaceae bacterium]